MSKKLFVLLIYILMLSGLVYAEMSFNSIILDYGRTMQLLGKTDVNSLNYHTYSSDLRFDKIESGPWKDIKIKDSFDKTSQFSINILSPEVWTSWNSTSAWGGNDGSLWQGKGFNSVLSGGFEINNPYFSIRFLPEIWGAQNLNIDIINGSSNSEYGDYWTVFDNLQRYGDEFYYDFSWGQSDLRFYWRSLTVGFSTESIILGPGQVTNIILSNNAGGFPHFDMGTSEKINIGNLGDFEIRAIWGFLEESSFFDDNPSNNYGWISGTYIAWSPSFMENFTLGFNHQYYKPLSDWDSWDIVRGIPFLDRSNSPTDTKDMMMSVPFSWIFPTVGFEFYGEWARNDNFGNFEDLFKSPEHTQAFTIGINQVIRHWDDNIIQLSLEFSTIEQERTREVRAAGPWYRHGWAGWTQGYTNNGQLLGASIGPGSNSQWGKLSLINPKGKTSVFMQRIAFDKDYYYTIAADEDTDYFAEFNCGVEHLVFFNKFDLYGTLIYTLDINTNYISNNEKQNIHFELGLKYHL